MIVGSTGFGRLNFGELAQNQKNQAHSSVSADPTYSVCPA